MFESNESTNKVYGFAFCDEFMIWNVEDNKVEEVIESYNKVQILDTVAENRENFSRTDYEQTMKT